MILTLDVLLAIERAFPIFASQLASLGSFYKEESFLLSEAHKLQQISYLLSTQK